MRKKPEALDYEGVFPPKFSRPRESAAPDSPIEPDIVFSPSGAAALPSNLAPSVPAKAPSKAANAPTKAPAIPGKEEKPKPSFMELEAGMWTARRGHGVTFALLFVFSIVLYFRPYELIPALSSFKSMAFYVGITTLVVYFISQLVSEGNLTVRPREVNMVLLVG